MVPQETVPRKRLEQWLALAVDLLNTITLSSGKQTESSEILDFASFP